MNILLESRAYFPSIGGLETSSLILADEWLRSGNHVRIVTETPLAEQPEPLACGIYRQPTFLQRVRLLQWCDIFVQSGFSARSMWLPLAMRIPVLAIHRNLPSTNGKVLHDARIRLKYSVMRLVHNVAVSSHVAEGVGASCKVIENAFRPTYPIRRANWQREELLFVGRLVSDKGVDIALDALALLHREGYKYRLRICGDGPEKEALQARTQRLGLERYVTFEGWVSPEQLAWYYSSSEALVVPSRYEPFGNVALEALSYDCPVVAARVGGLPSAVGPGGLLHRPEDSRDLADKILDLMRGETRAALLHSVASHLMEHAPAKVASRYLHMIRMIVAPNERGQ